MSETEKEFQKRYMKENRSDNGEYGRFDVECALQAGIQFSKEQPAPESQCQKCGFIGCLCDKLDQQPQVLRDLVKKWCSKVSKAMSEGMTFDTFTQGFLYDFKNALIADQQSQDDLLNLLAIIHRDGGHYTNKHGLKKSVEDAKTIVSAAVQSQDQQPQIAESFDDWMTENLPGEDRRISMIIWKAGQKNCNCQENWKRFKHTELELKEAMGLGQRKEAQRYKKLTEKMRMLCQKFVDKVESGRARSKETYADCKAMLAALEELEGKL